MGLLSKLGGAVKEGLRNGAVNGVLKLTGNNAASGQVQFAEYTYDANGNIKGINSQYAAKLSSNFGSDDNGNNIYDGNSGSLTTSKSGDKRPKSLSGSEKSTLSTYPSKYTNTVGGLESNSSSTRDDYGKPNRQIYNDSFSDIYKVKLPDWTYADFINERAIWQKGLSSIFDEPAWFYFKIFFDFDTNHGLFGGLLNSTYLDSATNSAAKYLYTIRKIHAQEKVKDRINALYKFASILSFINTSAPWYFKSVKNLNKALIPIIDDFSKENYIEIETLPDAIDMRLSTLMSLYNFACYDSYQDKEIIPQNLRKFNMTIILFQAPLRYLHTSYTTNEKIEAFGINTDALGLGGLLNNKWGSNKIVKYKSMSPSGNGSTADFANTMSMKAITLYGCEFDRESLGVMIPNDISNEKPFNIGQNTIKITYTSAVEHTMNEFYGMMFGSDGFYFNQYSNFQTSDGTWDGYINNEQNAWNNQLSRYETLSETFGNLAQGGTILGIIDSPKKYKEAIDATESIMNGIGESSNLLTDLGTNFVLGLLGSSKNTQAPQGNIYGDYGLNSAYYKDKLEMLKNGVHERTQAPYYYDPNTGAKVELNKSKNYTAYNFKNDISSIKNFDVNNWLQTNTQKMGSNINNILRGS